MAEFFKKLFKSKQKFNIHPQAERRIKILLYGDIDMNLIDGSSIWLNSIINVLALEKSFHVTVLLKARMKTDRLIAELNNLDNIQVINTFSEYPDFSFQDQNWLTIGDALTLVNQIDNNQDFDCIILRGFELCYQAVTVLNKPERIIPYITNFTQNPLDISENEVQLLRKIFHPARVIFAQTLEMKKVFNYIIGDENKNICILTPMIPNFPEQLPSFRNENNTLVYTGKFSNDYMLYETLQAFQAINDGQYKLNVVGDKFHRDLIVPKSELVSLMNTMANVCWWKGIPRHEVETVIQQSDLGLSWRSSRIDNNNSLELSTKILEYGRLGRPVLLRRIPIHENLLGIDYPFYIETIDDLIRKIKLAFSDQSLYKEAAQIAYKVSRYYSFDNAIERLKPIMLLYKT